MKHFSALFVSVILAIVAAVPAQAVQAPLKIDFVLPTTGCTIVNGAPVRPCDNVPLTGPNALTFVDFYISLTPIPDGFAGAPTVSIPAGVSTTNTTFTAVSGDTVYVRVKARNASGLSDGFSAQTSKTVIVGGVQPGIITSVTISINIT